MEQKIKLEDNPILVRSIHDLPASDEFQEMAVENNFSCLKDIIQIPVHEFVKLPGSGFRVYIELMKLLDKYGLFPLLKVE